MSGTPLARPAVWRLWWSFTWRQAAAFCAAEAVKYALLAASRQAGASSTFLFTVFPWLTFAAVVFSGLEASRRLLIVYDIRLHGAHTGEQNHRHGR